MKLRAKKRFFHNFQIKLKPPSGGFLLICKKRPARSAKENLTLTNFMKADESRVARLATSGLRGVGRARIWIKSGVIRERMELELFVPIKLKSAQNLKAHWAKRAAIVRRQKLDVGLMLNCSWKPVPPLPCKITLVALKLHKMDSDNLIISFKAIKDAIAEFFRPGLAPGRADDTDEIEWKYLQVRQANEGVIIKYESL
jgi:hypothetical protein